MELSLEPDNLFAGNYHVIRKLGDGAFGHVFQAEQRSTGQMVAIKVLRHPPQLAPEQVRMRRDRLRREASLYARLWHPHVVRLVDAGETDLGEFYAVLEYVPGVTLATQIAERGALPAGEAVRLMTEVLDALACAHASHVVHRDLKPENIILCKTGLQTHAMVVDFGLGGFANGADRLGLPELTASQEMIGTPRYAAPEQLRSAPPSTQSDLYSWGLILLECLTGEHAIPGDTWHEVLANQLGGHPIPIPDWLAHQPLGDLLRIVTDKSPENRNVSVEQLLDVLDASRQSQLDGPRASSPSEVLVEDGERRQVTVLCVRWIVSHGLDAEPDPEVVKGILQLVESEIRSLVGRQGGHLVGVLGDRALVAFGYAETREHEPRRAARIALGVVAQLDVANRQLADSTGCSVQVGIGMHAGLVVVRKSRIGRPDPSDFLGVTPQIASQLAERAASSEILISGECWRSLRGSPMRIEDRGSVALPGLSADLEVCRLVSEEVEPSVASVDETPLVGRAHELGLLVESLLRARDGEPGAVLISGEPGIGKSRLVRELRRAASDVTWIECRCSPETTLAALRPVIDGLRSSSVPVEKLLGYVPADSTGVRDVLARLLIAAGANAGDGPKLSPVRERELTLRGLLDLLLALAAGGTVGLVVEDLHWTDPSTLELLDALVRELRDARQSGSTSAPRMCVVLTARPELASPWSPDDVRAIQIGRLSKKAVGELVRSAMGPGESPAESVIEALVARSEGVPLFVEEVARDVLARRRRDGDAAASSADIPSSLRELLLARIDGLSGRAREVLQIASVIGREVPLDWLGASTSGRAAAPRAAVDELVAIGVLFRRVRAATETYAFKHALVRDVAYEAIRRPLRRELHLLVARTLRELFPEVARDRPELIAHHLASGAEPRSASVYFNLAGTSALRRGALQEALEQARKGLAILEPVVASPERTKREVELLVTLGTAQFSTLGYAHPDVRDTFSRAWRLCGQLDEDLPLEVLNGVSAATLASVDREGATALRPRFEKLAGRPDPVSRFTGQSVLGVYDFYLGRYAEAARRLGQAREILRSDDVKTFVESYGYDGRLYCYVYELSSLWHLGRLERAAALCDEMLRMAESFGDPYVLCLALCATATHLIERGDVRESLPLVDRIAPLAMEQRLYMWSAYAEAARGAALVILGSAEEGLQVLELGQLQHQAMGLAASHAYFRQHAARAYMDLGRVDEARGEIEAGLDLCRGTLYTSLEPNFVILEGDLARLVGDEIAAESSYRRARALARSQGSRLMELRATIALTRLVAKPRAPAAVLAELRESYESFTEGRGYADLRAAHALMAELA